MGVSSLPLVVVGLTVVQLVGVGEGFPDGAPIEACILPHRNTPNHPGTKSQSPSTFKHNFIASGSEYGPGTTIQGE